MKGLITYLRLPHQVYSARWRDQRVAVKMVALLPVEEPADLQPSSSSLESLRHEIQVSEQD